MRQSASDSTYSRRRLNVLKSLQTVQENDTTPPSPVVGLSATRFDNVLSVDLAWFARGDDGDFGTAALNEISFVDPSTGYKLLLTTSTPGATGAFEGRGTFFPYRHLNGLYTIKTIDNAGNESTLATTRASAPPSLADPYVLTTAAGAPLSTGGTPLNLRADDAKTTYNLPAGFNFPFYGTTYTSVTISTNGILYFDTPPAGNDAGALVSILNARRGIAGMWDDLRTDERAGDDVYVVQPDADHVIFRWVGTTFEETRVGDPVNFEIELARNGTITTRYGAGNTGLNPVVGVSSGTPEAYVATAHTRDLTMGVPISLTNAQAVAFARRDAATPVVQFAATGTTVNEGAGSVTLSVTRTNNLSAAATVGITTVDDPADVGCADTTKNHGAAYARCDYATTVDTLTLAPGETSKDFFVPLINDVHVEGNETFQVRLANPEGATLGAPTSAIVTITDNDTTQPTTNPINQTPFFVRLQYLDFLSREPDPSGFAAWTGVLNNCSDVNNNPSCDRILVSSSFFGSTEFQLKGTFVFLFHKVAFGSSINPIYYPEYTDFAADLRHVTGATSEEVFAKRLDFTEDFVTRQPFINRYGSIPNTPSGNTQYVDTLLANVSATLATPDPQSGVTRNSLIADLNAGIRTRADVLRAIVESQEVNQKQFNFAFVYSQYVGYLRRTPDSSGYQAWLGVLQRGENFRTMVNGFMNSIEYRLRFGPNTLQ